MEPLLRAETRHPLKEIVVGRSKETVGAGVRWPKFRFRFIHDNPISGVDEEML